MAKHKCRFKKGDTFYIIDIALNVHSFKCINITSASDSYWLLHGRNSLSASGTSSVFVSEIAFSCKEEALREARERAKAKANFLLDDVNDLIFQAQNMYNHQPKFVK